MKRKATIGLIILFFFPFIYQSKASTLDNVNKVNNLMAAPVNDDCADATTLTVNQNYLCTAVTAGTLAGATASGGPNLCPGSATNANDDVWFKFVATATTHRIEIKNIIGNEGNITDLYHSVFESGVSGDCSSLLLATCSDPNTSNPVGLTIGNTYIIRIFSNQNAIVANTTFNVCIGTSEFAPPANDQCVNAEDITSLPFSGMYDASTATNNSGFITAAGCISMNDGVWYTLTGNGGNFSVTVSPTGWDAGIAVYTGSCGAFTCVTSKNAGAINVAEAVTFSSTSNTTYYVNIGYPSGTINGAEGNFNLGITSTVLSIDDIVDKGFYYYPNPVQNVLKMNANESIEQISLYTVLGREIKRSSYADLSAEIDMSNLASGTYFVRVVVGDSSGSFKIIKN